jgi:hypothetical protein
MEETENGERRTLAKEEPRSLDIRVLVRHDVQRARDRRGTAEEHTDIRLGVLLTNRRKDLVPVGTTEVCRRAQRGDGVFLRTDILNL